MTDKGNKYARVSFFFVGIYYPERADSMMKLSQGDQMSRPTGSERQRDRRRGEGGGKKRRDRHTEIINSGCI